MSEKRQQPSVVLSGLHVQQQQQRGRSGRMAAFAGSSQEPYKKKASSAGASVGKPVTRWRPSAFDFKSGSSVTCPTCQGTGRIPKGQEDELVALIPYNDKRLRPPRTCLYVSIVVVALLVSGGVLTAFFYPRNVDISIVSINASADYINGLTAVLKDNTSDVAKLNIQTTVKIKNSNFFPVQVSGLNVTLNNYQSQVGLMSIEPFSVQSRGSSIKVVVQNATFTDGLARRVRTICTSSDWSTFIPIEATVVLGYSYLSHTSDTITSASHFVDCGTIHSWSPARTIAPPNTTTPTQESRL